MEPKDRLEDFAPAPEPKEDFASMLADFDSGFARLQPGDKVTGRIVASNEKTILVDIQQRCEGVLLREDFKEAELAEMNVGDSVEAFVVRVGGQFIRLSRAFASRSLDIESLKEAKAAGIPIEGKISEENKGGFSVELPGGKGFVPHSQIAYGPKLPSAEYVGQTFRFKILEIRGRDVILSRALLQREEAEAQREKILADLVPGREMAAVVVKVETFGVFVDLGGALHGLVHVSQLGWAHQDELKAQMQPGQRVEVRILKVEKDKDGRPRISCSLRQPDADPWIVHGESLLMGQTVRGTVTRLAQFGAFVEVAPGIEGLLHVSEMSLKQHVRHPSEVVKPGDSIEVQVTAVDPGQRRVSLSLKSLQAAAETAIDPEARERWMRPEPGPRSERAERSAAAAAAAFSGAPSAPTAFAAALARAQQKADEKAKKGR